MKVAALNPKTNINLHIIQIVNFLKSNLKTKDISFDQIRNRLQIKISDKTLHRICIDAGYGVIK